MVNKWEITRDHKLDISEMKEGKKERTSAICNEVQRVNVHLRRQRLNQTKPKRKKGKKIKLLGKFN